VAGIYQSRTRDWEIPATFSFPLRAFHEKASQESVCGHHIVFGGSLNVILPSALVMGLLVTRCMLGSVVGLQPSRRTRCCVASWQPVQVANRSHPDGT
jgi:hypothetical protein